VDRAGFIDLAHEEKRFSFSHCIIHTTQKWKIILGKYLGNSGNFGKIYWG
jgi:hypothetical protein